MEETERSRSKYRVFLIFLTVILSIFFIYYAASRSTVLTHGFASYYTFSKILAGGDDLYKAYDTVYFYTKMAEFGFGSIKDVANNLPTSSLAYLAAAVFDPPAAKAVWTALSLIFLVLSIFVLLKTFRVRVTDTPGFFLICLALIFYPVYYNIALGQIYLLLLLLFSISLYGLKNNDPWLTAIPLSLILMIKGYGVIPLIFLLFMKKYKEFSLTLAAASLIFLATLPILGINTWLTYFNAAFPGIGGNSSAASAAYQTINSLVLHLFIYDPVWSPHPVILLSNGIAGLIAVLFGVSLIIFSLKDRSHTGNIKLFAAAISLNVILAPRAEEYHYLLFLPLIFVSALILIGNYGKLNKFLPYPVILFLMLALPLPYKTLQDSAFPLYLLAYPKLFAGIAFLFFSIKLNRVKVPG